MKGTILVSLLVFSFLAGVALAGQDEVADTLGARSAADELDLKAREIFGDDCATSGCHGGKNPKMDLSLAAADLPGSLLGIPSRQNPDLALIDVKDPSRSYLLLKITGGEGMRGKKMPIMKAPLSDEEIKTLTAWIIGFGAVPESGSAEQEQEDNDED